MSFIFAEDIVSAVDLEECRRLSELAKGLVVLELGSQFGRSTVALASTAARVHAVDWHRGDAHAGMQDSLPEYVRNLERHKLRDKVVTHVGKNEEVLPIFAKRVFDMVFIDSFHERAAVEKDIHLVSPAMKLGAIFAFHDYGGWYGGVTEAVNAFAATHRATIESVRSLAVVRLPLGVSA